MVDKRRVMRFSTHTIPGFPLQDYSYKEGAINCRFGGMESFNEPAEQAEEFSPGQAQRNEVERSAALGTPCLRFHSPL